MKHTQPISMIQWTSFSNIQIIAIGINFMESYSFTRRAFVLTGTVSLVSAVSAQEITSLQQASRAYYDSASSRASIETQVRSLLGKEIGSYGSLPVAGQRSSSTKRAQASAAEQFMQAYEVTTGVYQAKNGNLIVSAHQAHNTDQMAFILLHGNSINVLAAAILHNNCAKGALGKH